MARYFSSRLMVHNPSLDCFIFNEAGEEWCLKDGRVIVSSFPELDLQMEKFSNFAECFAESETINSPILKHPLYAKAKSAFAAVLS